jgi:hypothetical protein
VWTGRVCAEVTRSQFGLKEFVIRTGEDSIKMYVGADGPADVGVSWLELAVNLEVPLQTVELHVLH